jgi:hypothetical protein
MESSDKSVEEQVEHVDPSFTIFDSGTEPLEFLFATLPSDPTPYRYRSRDYFDYQYPTWFKSIYDTHSDL